MNATDFIKNRRKSLNLSEFDMSDRLGITDSEYWDIENLEIIEGDVLLDTLYKLSEILETNIDSLIKMIFPETPLPLFPHKSLSELRIEKGISKEMLSDIIGFKEVVIDDFESDIGKLATSLPLWAIKDLSNALGISILDIVHILYPGPEDTIHKK